MKNIGESLEAFENYKNNYKEYMQTDLSELDTRSKLIDQLLINVMGWEEQDIKREGHGDSGYYDYRISVPGVFFIIEAKKQFKEFILPSHHERVPLKALLKQNDEVIFQIRGYCSDESIPHGIVTNGFQFIFLRTINIDGKSWKENMALIFNGIDDIEKRFIQFYDNLSKYSVINNGGFKYELPINNFDGRTLLSTLVDKDKELIRNSLSAILTPIVEACFGEMFSEYGDDDLRFIKSCFVENAETKKNKGEIERLFSDDAPELNRVIPIVNTENLGNQIVQEIKSNEISIRKSHPPNPIVVIGSKGAGKTTFINHLFKYKFGSKDLENHLIIYIDFRRFYEDNSFFEPQKIAGEVIESIYTKYSDLELHTMTVLKRIYHKEIKRNDESTWTFDKERDPETYHRKLSEFLEHSKEDKLKHLTLLSHYLIRERRKRLIVIIDNADQFNDAIQEKLFVFSHSLTRSSYCGTVISLREGYYRKWQNSPPFDAYESNVYHITAPPYPEILRKRIDFAIEKARAEKRSFTLPLPGQQEVDVTPEYVTDFLKGLKNTLFELENSALLDFTNRTTFPNIREGLRVFKVFINSGHTKLEEYIRRSRSRDLQAGGNKIIPLHEFIKSIALQNRHYYNSEISLIYNLFIPPLDSKDHFIKLYILSDLSEIIETKNSTERLIQNREIVQKLVSLGYRANVINFALASLIKASLVDTDEQLSDVDWSSLPSSFNITLTAKGHYYLKELASRFHYYDLILQDTPVFDPHSFDSLADMFPRSSKEGVRNYELRKQFVESFFTYLEKSESEQGNHIRAVYGSVFKRIKKDVRDELSRMSS